MEEKNNKKDNAQKDSEFQKNIEELKEMAEKIKKYTEEEKTNGNRETPKSA